MPETKRITVGDNEPKAGLDRLEMAAHAGHPGLAITCRDQLEQFHLFLAAATSLIRTAMHGDDQRSLRDEFAQEFVKLGVVKFAHQAEMKFPDSVMLRRLSPVFRV